MILFSDYQTVVVQPDMMGKRNYSTVEHRRHINATTHKLVNKSPVMGCTHGVETTISYLIIK